MKPGIAARRPRRPLEAGEWLLVALAMVSVGLIAMTLAGPPKPPPRALPTTHLQVDGAVWRLPTDSGVAIEPLEGPGRSPASLADGRVHRVRSFSYDADDLQRLATARDAETLSSLRLLAVGGHARASPLPQRAYGEAFGPTLFGRPTVARCRPLRTISGKVISWCVLWGWAPGGIPIFIRYDEWRGDGEAQMRAIERLLAALRSPERKP